MKNHVKVFMEANGYSVGDWIPCKNCGATAVDINHIEPRGMGGSKLKDYPENLVALCRQCHIEFEQKRISKNSLKNG